MAFKKLRGVNLTHDKQGYVYFVCATYRFQPEEVQRRILNLCAEIGGEDYQVLFDVLVKKEPVVRAAMDHFLSEKKIYGMRKRFYESYFPITGAQE